MRRKQVQKEYEKQEKKLRELKAKGKKRWRGWCACMLTVGMIWRFLHLHSEVCIG